MYRKCTTEISALHQRQITQSLLKLMQKMPYENITVTQLCQTAEISRRTFYHLFTNKTGVLHALVDQKILNIESYGRKDSHELSRFFHYWKEQKPFLDALSANDLSGLLLERMIGCALTEDYDVHYWLRSAGWSENSREVIIFGLSGIMGLVYSWYHSGYRKTPEELAALVEQMILPTLK